MKKILWLNDDKYLIFDTDKNVCWNVQTSNPNTLGGEFINRLDAFAEGYDSFEKIDNNENIIEKKITKKTKNTILESKIEFKNDKINRITVLVEFSINDIRAIQADTNKKAGYLVLKTNEKLSLRLLEKVVNYGLEINKDEFFPDWKNKYKQKIKE